MPRLFLLAGLLCLAGVANAEGIKREYPCTHFGRVEFTFPSDAPREFGFTPICKYREPIFHLRAGGYTDEDFVIEITRHLEAPPIAALRDKLVAKMKASVPNSMEKEIAIKESSHGIVYITLTDRRPQEALPKGEFVYVTGGYLLRGVAVLEFQHAYNDSSGKLRDRLIGLMGSVRFLDVDKWPKAKTQGKKNET